MVAEAGQCCLRQGAQREVEKVEIIKCLDKKTCSCRVKGEKVMGEADMLIFLTVVMVFQGMLIITPT